MVGSLSACPADTDSESTPTDDVTTSEAPAEETDAPLDEETDAPAEEDLGDELGEDPDAPAEEETDAPADEEPPVKEDLQ